MPCGWVGGHDRYIDAGAYRTITGWPIDRVMFVHAYVHTQTVAIYTVYNTNNNDNHSQYCVCLLTHSLTHLNTNHSHIV